MVDVLITGSLLFDGREVIVDAYVYIKNGVVVDYGVSPVPEDYTLATLVLGGEGRVIMPGLAVIADPLAYPIRIFKPSMDERSRYYNAMGREALIKAGLPGIYELHMSGVTNIVVEAPDREVIYNLSSTAGGLYYLAVPSCMGGSGGKEGGYIILGGDTCGPGDIDVSDESYPILLDPLVYNAGLVGDVWVKNVRLRESLGMPVGISKGEKAEIVVYDSSRPPGMIPDFRALRDPQVVASLYGAGLKLESLIVGQDVLVDGGEHLMIVEKHFSEARRLMSRILKSLPPPSSS